MLYAVTIEPLNAIFFVSDRPEPNEWEVQEGVSLDMTPNYGIWTPDLGPLEQILCVSTWNPKHFRVFKNRRDIDPEQFRPVVRNFGGIFSKPSWERFAKHAPAAIATLTTEVDEPPGATEAAVAAIKRGG